MQEEFQEFIDFLIDKRLNDISLGLNKKDENYKRLESTLMEVQDKFISKDDEELHGLFVEYGDIINAETAIIYREIYIYAFKDALRSTGIIEAMKMK